MPESVARFESVIAGVVAAVFVALLLLETGFPLRQTKRSKAKRFVINVGVSAIALAMGAYVVGPTALRLSAQSSEISFGLLRLFPLPFAAEFILGFFLLDLSFYYWHRANHAFRFLWRFHNVHHVDPDLDVSTSFRFHFGEVFFSLGFRGLQVFLLGISVRTYLFYELAFQCATLFHHSNARLPIKIERRLNQIIVTPRMHGIHHSTLKNETNSNYSVIFRWWDRMHGTLRLNVKQSDVIIGVPAYLSPQDNGFFNLLILPFRKQRDYWRQPNGQELGRGPSNDRNTFLLA
jgi:sterol desaturase/sphingolipid hydroxylase (fatty acid hydroxylase superfamily)